MEFRLWAYERYLIKELNVDALMADVLFLGSLFLRMVLCK